MYHVLVLMVLTFTEVTTAVEHPHKVRNPDPEPTLEKSTDGLCGSINGFTCLDSGFSPCCRYAACLRNMNGTSTKASH
jgi:hypothetical protein